MKKIQPTFDYAAFEIRYASGDLFFDRCGQALLDIDRKCSGWNMTSVSLQTGALENPSKC